MSSVIFSYPEKVFSCFVFVFQLFAHFFLTNQVFRLNSSSYRCENLFSSSACPDTENIVALVTRNFIVTALLLEVRWTRRMLVTIELTRRFHPSLHIITIFPMDLTNPKTIPSPWIYTTTVLTYPENPLSQGLLTVLREQKMF